MNDKIWTVLRVLNWTTGYFLENGIENPRLDAEILLARSLRTNRLGLYLEYDKPLEKEELTEYKKLIKRRIKREPLQYIVGYQEFWSLKFKVDRGVLIPRPETEILVEEVLKVFPQDKPWSKTINILEIGTGSGAIAVTLAKELQGVFIIATDISDRALHIAKENAKNHVVERHITFLKGDLLRPVRRRIEFFDLVISNPPYIPGADFQRLEPEVRDFEPRIALDGGKEGLRFYRQILPQVGKHLAKGGWLMLEVGKGQYQEVRNLMESSGGFRTPSTVKDLSGIERVVSAQKKDRV